MAIKGPFSWSQGSGSVTGLRWSLWCPNSGGYGGGGNQDRVVYSDEQIASLKKEREENLEESKKHAVKAKA